MKIRSRLHFCLFVFLVFVQACGNSAPAPEPTEDLEAAYKGYFAGSLTGDHNMCITALKRLRRAMESGKLNHKQLGVAYYIRGFTHYGGVSAPYERYGKAIADFKKSMELDPDLEGHRVYGNAARRCAMAYVDRSQRYYGDEKPEEALKDANKAIEVCPSYMGGYSQRGRLFEAKDLHDLALADFDKVIENRTSYYDYYLRGFPWLNKGNYDAAIADFTTAIKEHDRLTKKITYPDGKGQKKYHIAYYGRALAYEAKGELKKALADAKIAFDAKPNNNNYQLLLNRVKNRISAYVPSFHGEL